MKKFLTLMFFYFLFGLVYSGEPEIRKPGDCGGHRVPTQGTDPEPSSGGEKKGLGNLTKEQKEEIQKFPKKIQIERSRLIARLQYLKAWDQNPMAVRNLLLFLEKNLHVKAITVKDKEVRLTDEQKLSIFDQLDDFEINLDEKAGDKRAAPKLGGDVPSPLGGEEGIATFEVLGEENQKEADSFVLLFMTGLSDFDLDEKHLESLRNYLLKGGFLFGDCASGNQDFAKGFRRMIEKMFPGRKLEVLPPSHPLFSTVFDLKKIRYTGKNKPEGGIPRMEGISVGCRTAVILSPDTVSCGWDGHMHGESVSFEIHYEDAMRFGANLLAYALGYREEGTPLQGIKTFKDLPRYKGEEVAFAQLKFQGDYDPDPKGIQNFIDFAAEKINMRIRPERILVDPEKDNLFLFPLVYMTGHGKISLSDSALSSLSRYLKAGGLLWAEACCGDPVFDHSFRELTEKCLEGAKWKLLPSDSFVYKSFYDLKSLSLSSLGSIYLKKNHSERGLTDSPIAEKYPPFLEAVLLKDRVAILYSPIDFACSWEKSPCLACKGVNSENAQGFKMGANVLIYAVNRESK